MKVLGLSLLALFSVGILFTVFLQQVEEKPWVRTGQEERYQEVRDLLTKAEANKELALQPKVVCEDADFSFGDMNPSSQAKHTFVIHNEGEADLIIRNGGSTCKCTTSDLAVEKIPPGGSYDVTLEWRVHESVEEFVQSAALLTNDPKQPHLDLVIRGRVRSFLGSDCEQLAFTRMVQGSSHSTTVELTSETLPEIKVARLEATDDSIVAEDLGVNPDEELVSRTIGVTVNAPTELMDSRAKLRIFLDVPKDLEEFATLDRQSDGTYMLELPVQINTLRKLSLYSPHLDNGTVQLGKLFQQDSKGKEWAIVARVRTDIAPDNVTVEMSGIEGIEASIQPLKSSKLAEQSFRITLKAAKELRVGVFNRETAGKLKIDFPGFGHEGKLEFPVALSVLAPVP